MLNKVIVFAAAFLLSIGCKPQTDEAVPETPQTTQSELQDALEKDVETFRTNTKDRLAKLDAKLQEATERLDKAAETADEDVKEKTQKMGEDAETALGDIKTRLDNLGNEVDGAAAKSKSELDELRTKIDGELEKIEADIDAAVDTPSEDPADDS